MGRNWIVGARLQRGGQLCVQAYQVCFHAHLIRRPKTDMGSGVDCRQELPPFYR